MLIVRYELLPRDRQAWNPQFREFLIIRQKWSMQFQKFPENICRVVMQLLEIGRIRMINNIHSCISDLRQETLEYLWRGNKQNRWKTMECFFSD